MRCGKRTFDHMEQRHNSRALERGNTAIQQRATRSSIWPMLGAPWNLLMWYEEPVPASPAGGMIECMFVICTFLCPLSNACTPSCDVSRSLVPFLVFSCRKTFSAPPETPPCSRRYEEAERIEEMLKSGALGGGQQNVSEKEAVAA